MSFFKTRNGNSIGSLAADPSPGYNGQMYYNSTSNVFRVYQDGLWTNMVVAPSANPSGAVIMFGGSTAPTGYLLCDGTSYTTASQPILFAAIGYTYGGSGANFNVPDARGIFVRGAGTNGTLANANGTPFAGTLGTMQNDQMQSHTHTFPIGNGPAGGTSFITPNTANMATFGAISVPTNDGAGVPRADFETAPANVSLTYIIKT
jgi:microcystin-dependent protein